MASHITPSQQPPEQSDERASPPPRLSRADVMAHLVREFRGDEGTLETAIATSTGEQRERFRQALSILRSEQR